ncbi:MAG: NDP-sugar synthase, partial [Deltaproteobacteria bacterium]|nr:NDP-sugar synthase [Deltaproteobacteria bacterium]
GIPLLAYTLALLARHGVSEVIVNTHHLPDILMDAARRHCPLDMELRFSIESGLLDTGGGIRRVADYLRQSDPCLIVAGDMLLDADLSALVATHREHQDAWTMLLREGDPRAKTFGTIGVDPHNRVRRIGTRYDFGGEHRAGLYAWANVVAARAFDSLPELEIFSHFDDWIAPQLASGATDIRAEILAANDFVWEPVGTPAEYLAANLDPIELSYQAAIADAQRAGARIEGDVVIGAGAELGAGVRLQRAVVWDGEHVPDELEASDGIFAGGEFHPVE